MPTPTGYVATTRHPFHRVNLRWVRLAPIAYGVQVVRRLACGRYPVAPSGRTGNSALAQYVPSLLRTPVNRSNT